MIFNYVLRFSMFILGCILVAIALILFLIKESQKKQYLSLQSARSSDVAELITTANAIANDIGGGNWRDYVKLWGKILVDEPILSEIKQEPCVYYRMSVQREYEEKVRSQDSEGKTVEKTVRKSETIAQNQRSIPFIFKDKTGEVMVNPEGAKFDCIKILDEFRPEQATGGLLQYDHFSYLLKNNPSHNQTLGYRYQEFILPVNQEILLVGTVSDETGDLKITKPLNHQENFIISLKTDEALSVDYLKRQAMLNYGIFGSLATGIVLIVINLLNN